ncbi:hypothetical protein NDU88_004819 [Pleurodeles waltl]|uniref:Uncharacterized protein n=1 Tax=Pleurodeles waltl TaxID=8319 RepID=A0AAV7RHX7_PLEWA|nr:hypothetical protein NDU88_004819 [Pleurodeles waltl]
MITRMGHQRPEISSRAEGTGKKSETTCTINAGGSGGRSHLLRARHTNEGTGKSAPPANHKEGHIGSATEDSVAVSPYMRGPR